MTMAGQLIPLPELDPPSAHQLTMEQQIAAWFDLLEFGEQLLMAGKCCESGENMHPHKALRNWYAESMAEHDQMMSRMMEQLQRQGANHDCKGDR
jgi:hypothetical protein